MCFPLSVPNSKAFHDDLRNLDPWQKVRRGTHKVQCKQCVPPVAAGTVESHGRECSGDRSGLAMMLIA